MVSWGEAVRRSENSLFAIDPMTARETLILSNFTIIMGCLWYFVHGGTTALICYALVAIFLLANVGLYVFVKVTGRGWD